MKLDLFTLRIGGGNSFFARVDAKQMTVVDAFCVVESSPLPIAVGMCSLAIKMQFERAEEGTKQIRVSFADEDGKIVIPHLESVVDVKIPADVPTATIPLAFCINQLSLPAFGQYSINLIVDGQLAGSTSLFVRQKADRGQV